MLSIGEFSRVTRITIKALRLYHEKGILIPDKIDYDSQYRYYRGSAIEKALVVKRLKDMGFSLGEIKNIVVECTDDRQLVRYVEEKLNEINRSLQQFQEIKDSLSLFLQKVNEPDEPDEPDDLEHDALPAPGSYEIQREAIPSQLVAGYRFKGKYNEIGHYIGLLFKACGRFSGGKAFSLYYDGDYKEEDADIEVCVAVKKNINAEGIDCRILEGGQAVTLIHKGPYPEVGASYQKLYEYCREKQIHFHLPTREQYLKSPGFIFRGNPKKYLTKLILLY